MKLKKNLKGNMVKIKEKAGEVKNLSKSKLQLEVNPKHTKSKKVSLTNENIKPAKIKTEQENNDWANETIDTINELTTTTKKNKKPVKKAGIPEDNNNDDYKVVQPPKINKKNKIAKKPENGSTKVKSTKKPENGSTKVKSTKKPENGSTKVKSKLARSNNTEEKKITKSAAEKRKHEKQIESLKEIDPEFYQFLKDNDKQLLDFNWDDTTDEEYEELSNKEEDENKYKDEKVHIPEKNLEIASDESDFESTDNDENEEDGQNDSTAITLRMLRTWQADLQSNVVQIETIRNVIQSFSSALASVSDQASKLAKYKVDGSAAFNGIIQLCVIHLQQAIHKYLGINATTKIPIHKTKKWDKVRSCLRYYFLDLTRLIEHVSSSHILTVLLKHLHQMSTMVASFPTISKPILKRLIVLWSTSSEESIRVLSFLCILKMTRNQQVSLLNHILKAMYMSYVRNSKFVSPNTLPGINFMRRSLIEMFALDLNTTYQHAFLYIRQLAIHLRNAIILKKKDSFQAVYNWQFMNSIKLWSDLLGETANKQQLQPLIYPLVSITIGVIKLIPTAQYFPLRFHCIQSLISLSKQTDTYIPILPFILEVLNSNTFNKKHTIVSMKPMQFTCIIRLNKSQLAENGFRDEVIENVCGLLLEFSEYYASSIAFPDLVVPTVFAVKQYLKTCKNINYSRKLKQVLDKIMENSKLIENERNKINFGLKDTQLIQSWETGIRNKGVPLAIYYESWLKTHQIKKKRQAANTDNINDYNLPMIKRKKPNEKKKHDDDSEVELFPSDSEDDELKFNNDDNDEDEVEEIKVKKEKKIKKSKAKNIPVVPTEEDDDFNDDQVDIVKDLDIDDW